MGQHFIKKKEDFICQNCQHPIKGTGYTNHCPECFFSKHVDIYPGDRGETCHGLMKPTQVTGPTQHMILTHTCKTCGFTRNNKVQKEDNMTKLATLKATLNFETK